MRADGFSSGDVVRLTGIRFRTLDHWARTGFITPSLAEAAGTGTSRRYSTLDLIKLVAANHLRSAGVTTSHIKRFFASRSSTLKVGHVTIIVDMAAIAIAAKAMEPAE